MLYQQSSPETTWRPVACASRSLTPAERNDAQIEKEALAITWATSHFEMYLLGMHTFLMETDHKPLVPLLSMKRLHELPARVLRFRLRLARYSYTTIHVPGSHLTSADAFSRAPTDSAASCDDLSLEADCSLFAAFAVSSVSAVTGPTRAVLQAQKADTTCQDITRLIRDGLPSSIQDLPAPLRSD